MRHFWIAFALILVIFACLPAYCTIPSFRGYTGLIVVPTADALGKGDWNAGVFWENVAEGTISDVVANYGISQGLELGVDRFGIDVSENVPERFEETEHRTLVNAKYRFVPQTMSHPAIAAGIIDITNDVQTTVYAVASMGLPCNVRVWKGEILSPRIHVGFGGGRLDGLFAGASAYIGNRLELLAEWDSKDVNVGIRWRVTPEFTIHGGGININDREDDRFTRGASFGVGASWNMTY